MNLKLKTIHLKNKIRYFNVNRYDYIYNLLQSNCVYHEKRIKTIKLFTINN